MPADSDAARRALLPAGLPHGLPPDAAHRPPRGERLVGEVGAPRPERVEPPLGRLAEQPAPRLGPAMVEAFGCPARQARALRAALAGKDADAVATIAGPAAAALGGLMAATGPGRAALMMLTTLELPAAAEPERARLAAVIAALL